MTVNGESSYSQQLALKCTRNRFPNESEKRVFNGENLKVGLKHFNPKSNNFHIVLSPEMAALIQNFYTILSNLNPLHTEKWYLNEVTGASFSYLKNILTKAKNEKLIKNFTLTSMDAKITFNRQMTRGNQIQNVTVNICEPYSQILTHIMVNGGISYEKVHWKLIEDQECGKRRHKAYQVRFFNYVTKQYQYVTNERLSKNRNWGKNNQRNQQRDGESVVIS